jgi:uncharacterized oligopeptide transporter (OPT) family protein
LFASLARGFFGDEPLDWLLIGSGAGIGLLLAVVDHYLKSKGSAFRTHVMPVAVGMYLPFGISATIFAGGLLAWLATRRAQDPKAVHHRGMLYASGLIAGESLVCVAVALAAAASISGWSPQLPGALAGALTVVALALCGYALVRSATRG